MRLWDHIQTEGFWDTKGIGPNWTGKRYASLRLEHEPVVVAADNVARYLYEETDQEHWQIGVDFPNVAPPWPFFFIEYRAPRRMVSEVTGVTPWDGPEMVGTLFSVKTHDEFKAEGSLDSIVYDEIRPVEGGWVVIVSFFAREQGVNAKTEHPVAFRIDPDGTVPLNPSGGPMLLYPQIDRDDMPEPRLFDVIQSMSVMGLWVPFLTLSFLHCKNVTLSAVEHAEKLQRRAVKRRGRPLETYHVLNIEPMTQIIRQTERDHGVGTARALHIARGHFKDYSKGKGLFGRHKGMYWWPSTVRGTESAGVRHKDYEIGRPR